MMYEKWKFLAQRTCWQTGTHTCSHSFTYDLFIDLYWFSLVATQRRTARGSTEISGDAIWGNRLRRAKKERKNESKADLNLCHQMCKVNVVCNIHKCDDLKSASTQLHPWATDLTSTFWVTWLKTQMWLKQHVQTSLKICWKQYRSGCTNQHFDEK